MSRTTARIRNFSAHLIAHATHGNKSSPGSRLAAFAVCEELRPQLAMLIGKNGFRTLLARALTLAKRSALSLRAVEVTADGSLTDLGEVQLQGAAKGRAEGGLVLIAELLGLLIAFIGEDLTLRMVRDVWPQLPLHDFDLPKGHRDDTKE